MTVGFLEVAQQELDEAIIHYDGESPGLGNAFLLETLAAIERIRRFPDAWHPLGNEFRRCRLRRFPYGLIYAQTEGDILILAIAHTRREPGYWRDRIKPLTP